MAAKKSPQLEAVNPLTLRHNMGVLGYFRTFVSIITGAVVGLLGVQGWWGFLPHFITQLLCVVAMFAKGGAPVKQYWHTWPNLLFFNVFSSVTLLSYMLLWTALFNIAHVFV